MGKFSFVFRGKFMTLFLVFLMSLCGLYGQNNSERRPVDDMIFKVIVYGPSDEIFIWWGHAALIVENIRWHYSRVFDWGIFSYPGESFLWDFLHNRISYKCTVDAMDLEMYIDEDRDITLYTLDLEAEQKELILAYAENNVLPENCYYNYHEFRDNCSTRIRDIVDMGTRGQLKETFANTPARYTLRQHIRRFTWFRPFEDWVLDFLMGQDLDEGVTVWDEMFLPIEVGRNITDFKYADASGAERRLVSSVEILNVSKKRQPILNLPLRRWPGDLMLGMITALILAGINALRQRRPLAGRILWAAAQVCLGLALGAVGCVLTFGLFFLGYDYIRQNINILFINPLLLAAAPLGILVMVNRKGRFNPAVCLRVIWICVFVMALLTLGIKALPPFFQQNQPVHAFILPIAGLLSCIKEDGRYGFIK